MTLAHAIPESEPARADMRAAHLAPEAEVITRLMAYAPSSDARARAQARAVRLVEEIRADDRPGLMEVFLSEYGLSTKEGVALMCLAEALLRVPDPETMDALIEDKIAPSQWGAHLGQSSSSLVNASTWALMLTGRVLREEEGQGIAATLRSAVKRLGEPVIRTAVRRAMKEMGNQFVLGETIGEAVSRGRSKEAQGYTFSYDMLGEAALTARDAEAFRASYADAIAELSPLCRSQDVRENPGISVKLSALHPRYEESQRDRVMDELVPTLLELARAAKAAGMGFNIDAEEADRLDLSLDVIEAVLLHEDLAGWDGFGVVVQAYSKRALPVIEWIHALAERLNRNLMVRLVKGAYWDTEVKRAQVEGLPGFPVFTRKAATDVSYLCCASRLLQMTDRLYPQFATHNAHTVATILEMGADPARFEFQRLHGMGEAVHDKVLAGNATRCRVYAPVGAHRDLLAYLVRRLLENGANSSFVNQIVDADVPAVTVAADPFLAEGVGEPNPGVTAPSQLFGADRVNARGFDLHDRLVLGQVERARAAFRHVSWEAAPLTALAVDTAPGWDVMNPANPGDRVGAVRLTRREDVTRIVAAAEMWGADREARGAVLRRAADLYEAAYGELFALLTREAGKTPKDAVAELREAVDFLRYYGAQARGLAEPPRGVFACISPWNFPLAIFTGQVAAALAAGNAVVAKPAEATPLIAARAVSLLHQAGVPRAALQLVPGRGAEVGAALSRDSGVSGLAFTGSTATAHTIHSSMAAHLAPDAPLIAETGGLNAMIVDSTALPEQAVKDIVTSAFQSAGQRCSALRLLFVQEDIAPAFLQMLMGAMDEVRPGDPWDMATDLGPVIDAAAKAAIEAHVATARAEGRVLKELEVPAAGHFVAPCLIRVNGMADLTHEVFGPVLHVATFQADDLPGVVDQVNASGYGLTFGLHSRIDDRVEHVAGRIRAGNLYINRNQIGAVVGSQPFGGEGLSGTGPKAGGPAYVPRFSRPAPGRAAAPNAPPQPAAEVPAADLARALEECSPDKGPLFVEDLPGPTGESNRLAQHPRGRVLCLGPGRDAALEHARQAREMGCGAVAVAVGLKDGEGLSGYVRPGDLRDLGHLDAVAWWGDAGMARILRQAMSERGGAIIPLLTEADIRPRCILERHTCIDTTAAGGNATLLAEVS